MKANEIKQKLEERLVGQEYNSWYYVNAIRNALHEIMPGVDAMQIQFKPERQTVEIMYKDHYWLRIEVKKQRGNLAEHYLGHDYDWTYKSIDVYVYGYQPDVNDDADAQESLAGIEQAIEHEKDNKRIRYEETVSHFRTIMQALNLTEPSQVFAIVSAADEFKWSEQFKADCKKDLE